ncbi:transferase [Fulvitalea axinellae]|uniref:Transferase n=1 Tax=Fulvitalea axinellae TaxID=1182444 RepID=A0AAU9CP91_9BACT|nr:transferase [Fulvitalea axinellae]
MKNPVIIFGSTGIARAALEIFNSNSIVVYGFLDDDKETHGNLIDDISVLSSTDDHGYLKLIGKKCEAFVATDDNELRREIVDMLKDKRKVMPTNAVHNSAVVSPSAHLGYGNFINANATVGAGAKVPNHCILNSGAIVEYGAKLEDFVQVGAGSIVGANAEIAESAFIGAGVTIVAGVKVGAGARIGAGSVVVADVPEGATMFGNPAKPM